MIATDQADWHMTQSLWSASGSSGMGSDAIRTVRPASQSMQP